VGNTRKPAGKVMSISGDRITDADYEAAAELQAHTLRAQQVERACLDRLKQRLAGGAVDAGRKYYLDVELGIVRRRDKAAG